jgi:hypothetical protein
MIENDNDGDDYNIYNNDDISGDDYNIYGFKVVDDIDVVEISMITLMIC